MRSLRRLEILLFAAAFFAFAYFNQGGGWNQNSRFAEVRAMAEQGTFAIDDFLIYRQTENGAFVRDPIRHGDVMREGKKFRLAWGDAAGERLSINGLPPDEDAQSIGLTDLAASGDVAFARRYFHPNKPPGTSFLALPGYLIVRAIEKMFGAAADDPWLVVVNGWLASVFSVSLLAAAGCVFFFRIALKLSGGKAAASLLATLVFAFGTLFFPFATLLFDHDLTAACLLASFYWAFATREPLRPRSLILSGLAAGTAAITNYVAALAVVILAIYLAAKIHKSRASFPKPAAAFGLGVLGPFLLILIYNQICYGSPFALSNSFQNPLFNDPEPKFLGMFGIPRPDYALMLLISPLRGLFYSSPVLLIALIGWWKMRATHRAEAWLIAAMFSLFFLVNTSFVGWHAGFSSGPRYLIPGIAFLALPLVFGFQLLPRISGALAAISIFINSLFTIVDPESPAGVGSLAMVDGRAMWSYSPFADYALPLFLTGRAWPILNGLIDMRLTEEIEGETRETLLEACRRGDRQPIPLASFAGPASVNPIAVFEGNYFQVPNRLDSRMVSFNAGELLFPGSRWSLLPLGILEVILLAGCRRELRRADR